MYYFFKTTKIRTKIKVNALPGQEDSLRGKPVDTTFNVACSHKVRDSHPIGSIFYGKRLHETSTHGVGYYTVTDFTYYDPFTCPPDVKAEYDTLYETGGVTTSEPEEVYVDCDEKIEPELNEDSQETIVDSLRSKILKNPGLVAPTSSVDGFYMTTEDWTLLVRNIQKHINTMILGATGVGKTSCIKLLCQKMGLKLHIFDMGSMIDPISSLLGVHRLEGGASIFDYAKFTQVIQEPCVILLDELSRAALSTMNILFPCLDDRRTLSIEIAGGKDIREIKVHPEVTFIATANVGAEYSGTNSMDRALVNRFFPIELGGIPNKEESQVLQTRTKIDKTNADLIVKVANTIRSLHSKSEISISLSIRETLLVAGLVSDGWDLGKAMEMIYLPLYEGTKSEGERATVYKTISSY